jgi:hypothetical protein
VNNQLLRQQLDQALALSVEDECERIVALARFGDALERVVGGIAHPALTIEQKPNADGRTFTLRLLGRVVMRWCFSRACIDVHQRDFDGATGHIRLRYASHAREWRISMPGVRPSAGSFTDEEDKVREMVEDACRACTPWVGPRSVAVAETGTAQRW